MTGIFGLVLTLLLHPPREFEMTERMAPPGWQGKWPLGRPPSHPRVKARMAPM